jgi:hypothetical protein
MNIDNNKSDTENSYLRIAAVQIDYQPSYYLQSGAFGICEPIITEPISNDNNHEHYLANIKKTKSLKGICESLIKNSKSTYIETYIKKLEDILKFCFDNKVNLLVFPEYSIPVQAIETLMGFSSEKISSPITIIAGIGYLGEKEILELENLKIPVGNVSIGHNAAIILSPDGHAIVSKKKDALGEIIEFGNGPEVHHLKIGDNTLKISVCICLDYITEFTSYLEEEPDIVVVSALSKTTKEFFKTPRNFITVFTNHSLYGGTCISSSKVGGEAFISNDGTEPLSKLAEAIVVLDWNFNRRTMTIPSILGNVAHPIFAVSQIIYAGHDDDLEISKEIIAISDLMKADSKALDRDSISSSAYRLLELIDKSQKNTSKNKIIKECFENLADRDRLGNMKTDRIRSLARHCILREDAFTTNEWRYQRLNEIIAQFKKVLQEDRDDDFNITDSLNFYKKKAKQLSIFARSKIKSIQDRNTIKTSSSGGIQSILFARLGNHTTKSALKTLPKQLAMLKTIALSLDPNIVLSYRLRTEENSFGFMNPIFEVICTTKNRSEDELEELREGLGQLIHITFIGAYSIEYSFEDKVYEESFQKIQNFNKRTLEIEVESNTNNQISSNPPDWGMIIDLLKSLKEPVLIELQCSKYLQNDQPEESSIREILTTKHTDKAKTSKSFKDAKSILNKMLLDENNDVKNLILRIFIGSEKEISKSVLDMIGIQLSGGNEFNINPYSDTNRKLILKSPAEVLKTFHTSSGSTYETSGGNKNKINKAVTENQFPADGIILGKANIRTVKSDKEIDVLISPEDRLKHTYIIGRTGSGKTNLMKSMAEQDVKCEGRGITIIDPHGDLVDYVLKTIPRSRQREVTLIDLSIQDVVPVLNPLDLDINDIDYSVTRDRTIQQLINLLKSRVYHEHTGPVFEEIVGAVFETMLDPGYPVPASFTEIPSFLMDKDLKKRIINILVTSKFRDIARDATLKCVFGGAKSTINIDKIVNSGGILLVKIPEAVIGKSSADFIGSLILIKLRMAIMRRRQQKQQPYHFVYVDEFQNFVNADFDVIVAEARKFNVGFTLAHQNLEQLREFDRNTGMKNDQLINSIIGNVGNLVIFSHGIYDAEVFSKQLGVKSEDLMRIGKYEAIAKILIDNDDTNPFTLKLNLCPERDNPGLVAEIEATMRENGIWQEREKLLVDISKRIDNINEIITQKEKEKEENKKNEEDLKKKLLLTENLGLVELERMLTQHETSIWIELFLMDKESKNIRSLGKAKMLIEVLVFSIFGIKFSQVLARKKGATMQEILRIFHDYIVKYANENSKHRYGIMLREAYDTKDKNIFETEDISLFFKDAYSSFLEEVRLLRISHKNLDEL